MAGVIFLHSVQIITVNYTPAEVFFIVKKSHIILYNKACLF